MKTKIEDGKYDTRLESSDWRFSAAIVGLIKYFNYNDVDYEIKDDFILYNEEDIVEEKYIKFVESMYSKSLHHKEIENILKQEEIDDDKVKKVNEKLKANAILKKVFNGVKFDRDNREKILKLIDDNRLKITIETFGKMQSGLSNYVNVDNKQDINLFKDPSPYCRLIGHTIDAGKKGKSLGYNFKTNSFVGQDIIEFDFIPFAFSGDRESFFINDNVSIKRLKSSNEMLIRMIDDKSDNKVKTSRQAIFKGIIESSDFIRRDVEVIIKNRDSGYYETLFIRKRSIDILKSIKSKNIDYESLNISYKVTEKYYRHILNEVMNDILNNIYLDDLIELFLKEKRDYIVTQLIKINILLRGEKDMEDKLKGAYACAKKVASALEQNKLSAYRQKLTSAVIFKDNDRVFQILLQLSNYSDIEFGFVYDLYDNIDNNKDLLYTFINALTKNDYRNKDTGVN